MIVYGVMPAKVAALEHLTRLFDHAREAVAHANGGNRIEEGGGIEIGYATSLTVYSDASDGSQTSTRNSTRFCFLANAGALPGTNRSPKGSANIFEAFVAGGYRPSVRGLDKGKWLPIFVKMNSFGPSRFADVVTNDDGPIADRNVFERIKGINGRLNVPDGPEEWLVFAARRLLW